MAAPGGKGHARGTRRGHGPSPTVETITWPGSFGPQEFEPPLPEFPLQERSYFGERNPIRPYDLRVDGWPVCHHGSPCVVQVFDGLVHGGRRFFRCPNGQWNFDEGNCRFAKWVDPTNFEHTQEYINYMQNKICELQSTRLKLQNRIKDLEDEVDANAWVVSIKDDPLCTDPWCMCPYHHKKDPPPPGAGRTNEAGPSLGSHPYDWHY